MNELSLSARSLHETAISPANPTRGPNSRSIGFEVAEFLVLDQLLAESAASHGRTAMSDHCPEW
jgi:hypothetical protein